MQLKSRFIIFYLILACVLFCFLNNRLIADNISSQSQNLNEKQADFSNRNLYPQKLLYPDYFKKSDEITWENIKDSLSFKIAFLRGRRPEKIYVRCHRFQRRITKFVGQAVKDGELDIKEINNDFLFNEKTGIEKVFPTLPKIPSANCEFHSFGNLKDSCVLYCDYHGIDLESDFFKNHREKFDASKPLVTADDIAEFIIFSPSLFMLVIIGLLIPRKKKSFPISTSK